MGNISIFRVLDKMETAVRKSPRVPLTNYIMIDCEKLLGILEKMRISLPEEMKQARWVNKENQRILAEAQAKGENIINEAKAEAVRLVSTNEIVRQAKEQAARVTEEAKELAQAMKKQADDYAKGVLSGIESELNRITALVAKAKEQMQTQEQASISETNSLPAKSEEPQQMLIGS